MVLNQGRPGSRINEKALSVLEQYGLPVCPVPVIRRVALADTFLDGRAVAANEIRGSWACDTGSGQTVRSAQGRD